MNEIESCWWSLSLSSNVELLVEGENTDVNIGKPCILPDRIFNVYYARSFRHVAGGIKYGPKHKLNVVPDGNGIFIKQKADELGRIISIHVRMAGTPPVGDWTRVERP